MAIAAPLIVPAAEALWTAALYVASAIATAAGITAAGHAIDKEFSDRATTSAQSCPRAIPAPPPSDCAEIVALMEARIAELQLRYAEMLADKEALYPIRPVPKPPFGSWPGHIDRYKQKQTNLSRLMKTAAAKGCPIPPDAEEWATRPPPGSPAATP